MAAVGLFAQQFSSLDACAHCSRPRRVADQRRNGAHAKLRARRLPPISPRCHAVRHSSDGRAEKPRATLQHSSAPCAEECLASPLRRPLRAATVDASPAALPDEETSTVQVAPFEWKSNWYAVGVAQDLDPNRPHPLMVLGRRVVLWKDRSLQKKIDQGEANGARTAWRCFLDRCPHRLVPLSEGRIDEQGLLQCSYHGWTFAGDGQCQGIPQAHSTGPEHEAIKSRKACAAPFPITEEKGILFVWPDETLSGAERAARTRPPLPAGLNDSYRLATYSREVYYGYDMLAENVMDPSHLPFSHHGVGTLNRSQGQPFPVSSVISAREGEGGFVGRLLEPRARSFGPVQFQAPGLFTSHRTMQKPAGATKGVSKDEQKLDALEEVTFEQLESGQGGSIGVTGLYITPVSPGVSRLTSLQGGTRAPSGIFKILSAWRWPSHLFMHQVLDGDGYFLHAQEKVVTAIQEQNRDKYSKGNGLAATTAGSSSVTSAYFMPTSADRFVIGFRKWLDRYGGGGVDWPDEFKNQPLAPDWLPKEKILDRYASHTASCTCCQKALARFQLAQKLLLAAAAVLLVLAALLALGPIAKVGLLVASSALAGVGVALQKMKELFVYTGYEHAEK